MGMSHVCDLMRHVANVCSVVAMVHCQKAKQSKLLVLSELHILVGIYVAGAEVIWMPCIASWCLLREVAVSKQLSELESCPSPYPLVLPSVNAIC